MHMAMGSKLTTSYIVHATFHFLIAVVFVIDKIKTLKMRVFAGIYIYKKIKLLRIYIFFCFHSSFG